MLIAAKTYESLQYINQIIRERAISKEYLTRVAGKFPKHLIIDKAIEKTKKTSSLKKLILGSVLEWNYFLVLWGGFSL